MSYNEVIEVTVPEQVIHALVWHHRHVVDGPGPITITSREISSVIKPSEDPNKPFREIEYSITMHSDGGVNRKMIGTYRVIYSKQFNKGDWDEKALVESFIVAPE